jgi:hypothetical protein
LQDERHNRTNDLPEEINGPERKLQPRSEEEKKIWAALEQARQNVKAVVKKEMDAEIVTSELLNLRLRTPAR